MCGPGEGSTSREAWSHWSNGPVNKDGDGNNDRYYLFLVYRCPPLSLQVENRWRRQAGRRPLWTFPEGCCVHLLLLGNKSPRTLQLNTARLYHLTVLKVEKSGQAQLGSLRRLSRGGRQSGRALIWQLRGRSAARLSQVVGRIQWLVLIGLRCLFCLQALLPASRGCAQILARCPLQIKDSKNLPLAEILL